jgi:hypothetical protein
VSYLNPSQEHSVSVNTYLDKSNPDTTHSNSSTLKVGVADKLRTILEFPISDINPHQTISSAIISLNIATPPTASMACSAHILLKKVGLSVLLLGTVTEITNSGKLPVGIYIWIGCRIASQKPLK